MILKKLGIATVLIIFTISLGKLNAQIPSGLYISDTHATRHELKIDNGYFIYTVYETSPPKFIRTIGGFSQIEQDKLIVLLEFNSEYEQDSLRMLSIPFTMLGADLILDWSQK